MNGTAVVHFARRRIERIDGGSRDLMETHCGIRLPREALEDLPESAPWCAACQAAMDGAEAGIGGRHDAR